MEERGGDVGMGDGGWGMGGGGETEMESRKKKGCCDCHALLMIPGRVCVRNL